MTTLDVTENQLDEMLSRLKMRQQAKFTVRGHAMLAMLTDTVSLHTGRPRYLVACVSCRFLVSLAATGPVLLVWEHAP